MKNINYKNLLLLAGCIVIFITFLSVSCSSNSVSTGDDSSMQGDTTDTTDGSNRPSGAPNLLIIMADQWRGQALGFLDEDPVKTPNLDRLAQHSLVLDNFVTNNPRCSPSRAILMSGKYPFKNNVIANVNSNTASYNVELSNSTVTWSDVLSKNGYTLGYIGKWHLTSPRKPYDYPGRTNPKWNAWTPPKSRHGFDFWYSYGDFDNMNHPMYWPTNAGKESYLRFHEWEPQHDVDIAIKYLKNNLQNFKRDESKPFALVVSMNPPHTPYKSVPNKYYNIYKGIPMDFLTKDPDIPPNGTKLGDYYRDNVKYYYAAITGVDEQIGRLLSALKRMDLRDNTIILFLSDHGNNLGKHGWKAKNNIYEESLRVPFILSWKGHIQPGIDSHALMSMIDVYPTLLDMVGLKSKIPAGVEGKSWALYLLKGLVQPSKYQYILGRIPKTGNNRGFRAIRTQKYTIAYVKNRKGKPMDKYLYDRKQDPFELDNIYGKRPQVADSLKSILINILQKHTLDPFLKNFR